jgi:predicted DCC family thiol-disulfide oxidoreductase YuxK
MHSLTVLYDDTCGLCRRFRDWLAAQRTLVMLEFVPAGSAEARFRFPMLDHAATLKDVTVVADDGSVYVGDAAWIACLWATAEHRHNAVRLSRPAMRPVARAMVQAAAGLRSWSSAERGGDYPDRCDASASEV